MSSIRSRGGKLMVDFRLRGVRFREQTHYDDTQANRKKLKKQIDRMDAEITLGTFDYAAYFPNSPRAARIERTIEAVSGPGGEVPTFGEFAETWYDEKRIEWRDSYASSIRNILDKRLIPHFGEKKVSDITKADLLQFRAQLGKVKPENGRSLSASHINRHMKVARAILHEAADRHNFTSGYRGIKPIRAPKTHVDPFSLEEIRNILGAVRPDYKAYLTVRFFTGMRTGEVDGLKWEYVDLDARQILVRETIVRGKVEYTKTDGSQREIEMSQPVYEALKAQQKVTGEGDYVFQTRAGTPLSHHNVTKRVWYPLLNYLGLRRRRPYQMRHTAATLWLASGENPEWIARQLGHSNTEMLFRVYSRYVPNLTRRDGSAFENLLIANLGGAEEVSDA